MQHYGIRRGGVFFLGGQEVLLLAGVLEIGFSALFRMDLFGLSDVSKKKNREGSTTAVNE